MNQMNRSLPLVLSCVTVFCATAFAADCPDPQFNTFWTKFKTAVVKRDRATVASLTKLPYLVEGKQLNKQQFIAQYDSIFPKNTAACFNKEKPSKDQSIYEIFCGEQIYIFSKVNGKWLFTEIGAND